jgi:hypothetical protein
MWSRCFEQRVPKDFQLHNAAAPPPMPSARQSLCITEQDRSLAQWLGAASGLPELLMSFAAFAALVVLATLPTGSALAAAFTLVAAIAARRSAVVASRGAATSPAGRSASFTARGSTSA